MKHSWLLVGILLLISGLVAAQGKLDSLERVFETQNSDSTRFLTLIQLSTEAEFYDYRRARKYAEQATELADEIDADWASGKLYFRLSFLEAMEGDYAGALKYDQLGIKIAANDSTLLARMLNDVGTDYRDLGEYQEGYFYLTQSYRVARKSHKVLTHDDSLNMAIALHNIGTVFTALKQFDIALSHLQTSANLSAKIHDKEGLPYTYDELGILYLRKGDLDQAEKYLNAASKEANRLKIRVLVPRIKVDLAELYLLKKDYARSLALYDSIVALQVSTGNQFGLAECDLGKGKVLSRQGDFASALKLYTSALSISQTLHARNLSLQCYEELSNLFETQKDFEKSLYYLRSFHALRDSLFSEAAMEKLSQNQVRFETEQKDHEIEALSQQRQRQNSEIRRGELINNIMVLVVALTIILLFSVYRSSRRRKRINRLLLEHQDEIKRRSAELEQLNQVKDKFFSIISHDLRSPMNALAATLNLLEQNNITQREFTELTKTLQSQFNHTRALINNLLDWTLLQMDKLKIQPENVTLFPLVDESFNALQHLYPKNITMENLVPPTMACKADPNILNLILRNLILNAIKFTSAGGTIRVSAKENGMYVQVCVSDNGIGILPEIKEQIFERTNAYTTRGTANEKGTGLGLILCKEFIEKSAGKIWVESNSGEGSSFFFELPKA